MVTLKLSEKDFARIMKELKNTDKLDDVLGEGPNKIKHVELSFGRYIEIDELANGDVRVTMNWREQGDGIDKQVHELHSVDFRIDGSVVVNKATYFKERDNGIEVRRL